jgi:hypothetical protein
VQRFNLRKMIEPELRKQYQIKISNKFAALEISYDKESFGKH